MNKQGLVYTVVFTFVVCFVFVAILAFADQATAEQVEQNQVVSRQRAILTAMGFEFESDEEILELFEQVEEVEINDRDFYRIERDGEVIVATSFSGQGLWGTIEGILAMDGSLEKTKGLEIISHDETPGLGGRITESWFKEQFRDREVPSDSLEYVRNSSPGAGEFEAITGATGTTGSMEKILTDAIETFNEEWEAQET